MNRLDAFATRKWAELTAPWTRDNAEGRVLLDHQQFRGLISEAYELRSLQGARKEALANAQSPQTLAH